MGNGPWILPYQSRDFCLLYIANPITGANPDQPCDLDRPAESFFLARETGTTFIQNLRVFNPGALGLTVPANRSWQMNDVALRFNPATHLTVNGTLLADRMLFTGNSTWGGIRFAGPTSSSNAGAVTTSTISKVSTTSGGAAVTFISNATVTGSTIETESWPYANGTTFGVHIAGATAAGLSGNTIRSGSGPAVYVSSGYSSLHNNRVIMTVGQSYGFASIEASGGIVETWNADTPYDGLNKVRGNGSGGLKAAYGGVIKAGLGGGAGNRALNHFCDAGSAYVQANYGGTVYARGNYWPTSSGPSVTTMGGTFYGGSNAGIASCADVPSANVTATNAPRLSQMGETLAGPPVAHASEAQVLLFGAQDALRLGKDADAIALFARVLGEHSGTDEARAALAEVGTMLYRSHSPVAEMMLQREAVRATMHQGWARIALARGLAARGRTAEALELLGQAMRERPATPESFAARLLTAHVLLALKEHDAARGVLAVAAPNDEGANALSAARWLVDQDAPPMVPSVTIPDARGGASVAAQARGASPPTIEAWAYPNPFFSTSVVRFSVPEAGRVKVEVYDAAGRRVAVLVDDLLVAGTHEAGFNGAGLAPGVYFYRVAVGIQVTSGSITLVK